MTFVQSSCCSIKSIRLGRFHQFVTLNFKLFSRSSFSPTPVLSLSLSLSLSLFLPIIQFLTLDHQNEFRSVDWSALMIQWEVRSGHFIFYSFSSFFLFLLFFFFLVVAVVVVDAGLCFWKCVFGCWCSDVDGINETMAAIMNPLSSVSDRLAST